MQHGLTPPNNFSQKDQSADLFLVHIQNNRRKFENCKEKGQTRRNLRPLYRFILNELQAHGRLSIVDLAERVHLTKTPCSELAKRLDRDGIITGCSATIDPTEVETRHAVIVHVDPLKTSDSLLKDFNRTIKLIPEVQNRLMIAGPFDHMLKVRTRDIAQFRKLLGERLNQLHFVKQTHSIAVVEWVSGAIPSSSFLNCFSRTKLA